MKILTILISLLIMGVRNGSFNNPILPSDYSDPDVIRVGNDYWMTSSSFNCVPGLQILHSTDLVNWEIAGAALPDGPEVCWEQFGSKGASPRAVQHGNGVWAPCIRYHDGMYYIFWGDPDFGIFQVHTSDPRGEWSKPVCLLAGKGLIDTSPLWDDDGKVYLVHGWAGSRNGFKSMLSICELNSDCTRVIGDQVLVFDGNKSDNRTVEGPKFYKRDGWYYIFAPSGGVKGGWQLVLRSRNVYGPYEFRNVLHQGSSKVEGPHQGGWVTDVAGKDWFLHFEDRYAYGRVVHMQPMTWLDDGWCTMGINQNRHGTGEPVMIYDVPSVAAGVSTALTGVSALETGTNFTSPKIPLNWQWHARPEINWYMTDPADGCIRLNCIKKVDGWSSLRDTPNLLLEKIAGDTMTLTSKLVFRPSYEGDRAGLAVMGNSYASIDLCYDGKNVSIVRHEGSDSGETAGASETIHRVKKDVSQFYTVYLQIRIAESCTVSFWYSYDGKKFSKLGNDFKATAGGWIGAKVGFYALADIKMNDGGYVEVY